MSGVSVALALLVLAVAWIALAIYCAHRALGRIEQALEHKHEEKQ